MKFWIHIVVGVYLLILNTEVYAQQVPSKEDSLKFYNNLESYSKKHKFAKLFYHLVFKSPAPTLKRSDVKKIPAKIKKQKSYKFFEGKVIRKIKIETLDPFEYSLLNVSELPHSWFAKAGNKIHFKSQNITIRNLLLIRQNQLFDSLQVKESERLIRSQNFVQDVLFYVTRTSNKSDSVDIVIRVLDSWSIIPKVSISSKRIAVDLTDKNIIGLGHTFQNGISWNHTTGNNAFNTNYTIPNIYNTYIKTVLHYGVDEYENFSRSLIIERPFYSPLAKWAAGFLMSQQYRRDSVIYHGLAYFPFNLKYNTGDFWAGKAIQLFKGNSESARTRNLILASRYYRVRYLKQPDSLIDTFRIHTDENFYMASIGISSRNYIRDEYIFNYGIAEDVPVGSVYSITSGFQQKNDINRFYLGFRYSVGNYHPWGYFGYNFEYGSFFKKNHAEQGMLSASFYYFTRLFEFGNWKLRQFVKPEILIGINRFAYENLTLNEGTGLDGFNSSNLLGASRFLCTFQSQFYAPWNFIGFHFGPYINLSLGMLGTSATGLKKSNLYSQLGLGVLIKNEHLVFSTFQLSVSFFPVIPGQGQDIFKINSIQTTDFGFRDFVIDKPSGLLFK
ncbi:MAG: hypothetical protein IPL42_08720 [Saprospiraceae bacterium]|nr:hypothetical protein [Saprospiraceae bacterium]